MQDISIFYPDNLYHLVHKIEKRACKLLFHDYATDLSRKRYWEDVQRFLPDMLSIKH